MSSQRSLFDAGRPRPPDPVPGKAETSKLAAESINLTAGTLRRRVYDFLAIRGASGGTRDECCQALNLGPQTVCPRVLELIAAGLIEETDQRRSTRSGRQATVLKWTGSRFAGAGLPMVR